MTTPITILHTPRPPSKRLLLACAAFGLGVRHAPRHFPTRTRYRAAAAHIHRHLRPAQLALITGHSGAGKSTVLHELESHLKRRALPVVRVRPAQPDRAVIDLIRAPLPHALALLARVGLGDATLLGRTAAQLSDGERFRLSLAIALAHSQPGATILCDEFTSNLDRSTAQCVARGVKRWTQRTQTRFIAATPHNDVEPWLEPNLTMNMEHPTKPL